MTSGIKIDDIEGRKAKIVAMIAASVGGSFSHACKAAGINRTTGYQWLEADPQFQIDVDKAREKARESATDFVEGALMKSIKNGNVAAQIFYLKTQAKRRGYQETTLMGSDPENPMTTTVTHDATAEFRQMLSTTAHRKATSGALPDALDKPGTTEPNNTTGELARLAHHGGTGLGKDADGG